MPEKFQKSIHRDLWLISAPLTFQPEILLLRVQKLMERAARRSASGTDCHPPFPTWCAGFSWLIDFDIELFCSDTDRC